MVVITAAGVVASILSAVIWGLYPVLARYLMHRQPGKPPATSVLAIACCWNTVIIGAYYAYTRWILRNAEQTAEHKVVPSVSVRNEEEGDKLDSAGTGTGTGTGTATRTGSASTNDKIKVALAYGALCLSRMVTNMQSLEYTKAYLTQMTGMSLPFFTAILAYFLLDEKIHKAFFPAVLAMILGSLIVLYGQGAFSVGEADGDFTINDVYGILLQLASVVLSAMLKIAFKSTEGYLDTVELLLVQFALTAVPLLIYRDSLYYMLYELEPGGWVALAGISLGIYMFGNYLQIYAVRSIGASNHSASNSIRLVTAVAGSSLILKEHLKGLIGYFGCSLILIAVMGYWYVVKFRKAVAMKSYSSSSADVDATAATAAAPV